MTATDELRRMLDECGVEYTEDLGYREFFWNFGEHGKARASSIGTRGLVQMIVTGITPEQAIAATLGSCNCSNNCTNSERTETCHEIEDEDTGFIVCSECGAVHDESYTAYYCWCCGRRIEQ